MHKTTPQFWQHFYALPDEIQTLAEKQFRVVEENPEHPSLHFKKVGKLWSARVNQNYRALAVASNSR